MAVVLLFLLQILFSLVVLAGLGRPNERKALLTFIQIFTKIIQFVI